MEKLFRFVIFFITAHEYGHILNGDCGHQVSSSDRAAKEAAADEAAERLLEWCFIMQYRPDESETLHAPHRLSEDEFMNWFYELSPQGKLDYWRNSVQFRRQLSGDYQILKKAIQFSKGNLRQRILSM